MPEEGVELTPSEDILTTSEVIHLVKLFASQGVTKVRLTGGEPLLRRDLIDITSKGYYNIIHKHLVLSYPIGSIAGIQGIQSIGLTTNGVTLPRHAKNLKEAGLTSINVSFDTLIPEKFEFISRRKG